MKHYFRPQVKIYGIDINPACKQFEEDQIEIIIGDQEDRHFLKSIVEVGLTGVLTQKGIIWTVQSK